MLGPLLHDFWTKSMHHHSKIGVCCMKLIQSERLWVSKPGGRQVMRQQGEASAVHGQAQVIHNLSRIRLFASRPGLGMVRPERAALTAGPYLKPVRAAEKRARSAGGPPFAPVRARGMRHTPLRSGARNHWMPDRSVVHPSHRTFRYLNSLKTSKS